MTWGGDLNYCRALQRGSMIQWKGTVLTFADGNPVLMACIGVMLASPAIPFLPPSAEVNTIINLVNTTSLGKTMGLRGGASNWGEGSPTRLRQRHLSNHGRQPATPAKIF